MDTAASAKISAECHGHGAARQPERKTLALRELTEKRDGHGIGAVALLRPGG